MGAWKYMVLIAGMLGVGGFFAPFFEYRAPNGELSGASAYEVVSGSYDPAAITRQGEKLGLLTHEQAIKATHSLEQAITVYRGALVAAFVPAGLLALLGLGALARNRIGRLSGLVAIGCAVGCAAVYVFVFKVDRPPPSQASGLGELGLGVYLLLACGALGGLGGLGALVAPR